MRSMDAVDVEFLISLPCFWGPLSTKEAELMLSNAVDGAFLLRDSSTCADAFTISYKDNEELLHIRLSQIDVIIRASVIGGMGKRHNVFIGVNLSEGHMAKLSEAFANRINIKAASLNETRESFLDSVDGCDAVIVTPLFKIDEEFLNAAGESLRVVSSVSVGLDHIDVDLLRNRGVKIGYTPGIVSEATAETALSLMLLVGRKLVEANTAARLGDWHLADYHRFSGQSIVASTVGIVGCGRIGQALARRVLACGAARILYHNRNALSGEIESNLSLKKADSLSKLLEESDFVVSCLPSSESTRHMFNASVFERMKFSAVFVNVGRGDTVDQDALCDALRHGQIGGAGLDVTDPEPLPASHPLYQFNDCTILPHIGTTTRHTRDAMALLAIDNVVTALKDEPMPSEFTVYSS